jgi:hypothetical protein
MKTPIDLLRDKYFTTGMLYESDFTEADLKFEKEIELAVQEGHDVLHTDNSYKYCGYDYFVSRFGGLNK